MREGTLRVDNVGSEEEWKFRIDNLEEWNTKHETVHGERRVDQQKFLKFPI